MRPPRRLHAHAARDARDHDHQLGRGDRLGEVHLEAFGERADAVLALREGGERDGGTPAARGMPGFPAPDALQRRVAVLARSDTAMLVVCACFVTVSCLLNSFIGSFPA